MKDKYILVTECLSASRIQRTNLLALKEAIKLVTPEADGALFTLHNTIEGLRITEQKLQDVLDSRTVSVAT